MRAYNAGRPRLKIYQYDKDFKYMRSYESQVEIFNKYYDGKKGELFRNKEYKELPDGTYVATYRIGRDGLKYWSKIYNSVYCSKNITDKPFSAYNYLGEKVATFANVRVYSAITNQNSNIIQCRLHENRKSFESSWDGLTYKYDEQKL